MTAAQHHFFYCSTSALQHRSTGLSFTLTWQSPPLYIWGVFTVSNFPQAFSEERMERTLSIVKPDGVERELIGEVIKRFEDNGLKVIGLKMVTMSKGEAEGFYAVHRDKSFFESLTAFMSSGPAVVMVLEGDNAIQRVRDLMGATNPQEATEGTLRSQFGSNIERNIVHGSDGPDTATFEIGYFFPSLELVQRANPRNRV
jgi:nucleoside-diphosphate kinase